MKQMSVDFGQFHSSQILSIEQLESDIRGFSRWSAIVQVLDHLFCKDCVYANLQPSPWSYNFAPMQSRDCWEARTILTKHGLHHIRQRILSEPAFRYVSRFGSGSGLRTAVCARNLRVLTGYK